MKRLTSVAGIFLLALVVLTFPILSACSSSATPTTTSPIQTTTTQPAASTPQPAATTPLATSPASQVTQTSSPPQTLTFGLITSATGGMAAGFKSEVDAIKPTEDLLNQMGGITVNGQKYNVKIDLQDDQSTPQGAVTAANKLIQDGVNFAVEPMFIPNVMAVLPIFESAKVLSINPMCANPALFGGSNSYAFNAWPTAYNVPFMDQYLLNKFPQVKKIALVYPDDPGAKTAHDLTLQDAQKFGLQVVFDQPFATDTQDFAPIITKALATKPDVIDVLFTILPWAQGIINGARQQGFSGPVYAPCAFGDINILKSMVNPAYASNIISGAPDVLSPTMPDIVKQLGTLVESQVKTTPFNMDNVNILQPLLPMIQGIEKAQSLDPTKVVTAMESIQSYDLVWGKGTPGGQDTGGNHNLLPPIPVSTIMNGKVGADIIQR